MADFSDFDRYVEENDVPEEALPQAFAEWLANLADKPIIFGPADEPPEGVALPDESD